MKAWKQYLHKLFSVLTSLSLILGLVPVLPISVAMAASPSTRPVLANGQKPASSPSASRSESDLSAMSPMASVIASPMPSVALREFAPVVMIPLATELAAVEPVTITESGFDPAVVTITVGNTVKWTNATSHQAQIRSGSLWRIYLPLVIRNYSSGQKSALAGLSNVRAILQDWDSGSIDPGGVFTHTFDTIGDFGYYWVGTSFIGWVVVTGATPCIAVTSASYTAVSPVILGDATTFEAGYAPSNASPPMTYTWDFGSGPTVGSSTINHTFPTTGTFVVTLTVDNPCGSDTFTDTVEVVPVGACIAVTDAAFTSDDPVELGQAMYFTATATPLSATSPLTYTWDFGSGPTVGGSTINYTFPTTGTFVVTLTVENPCGSDTFTDTVEVMPVGACIAVADAAFTSDAPVELGQATYFTATATPPSATSPLTYTWDFGSGPTAGGSIINHTFPTTGTFVVTLTVDNPCGSDTFTDTVEVVPVGACIAVTDAAFTSDSPVELGQAMHFTATATPPNATSPFTYTWDFGGGPSVGSSTINHTFPTAGTYVVTLTVANPCGSDTYTDTVEVVSTCVPVTDAAFTSDGLVELGQAMHFTATVTPPSATSPFTYTWDFGSGPTVGGSTINYTFPTTGMFVVTLTVANPCGSDTFTDTVEVVPVGVCIPVTDVDFTSNSPVDLGQAVNFASTVALPSATPPLTYTWDFGGAGSQGGTDADPTYTYIATGIYSVVLTVTNLCGGPLTATHPVTVNALMAGVDLVVDTVETDPLDPIATQPMTITVAIRNRGDTAASGTFYTSLYIDPTSPPALYQLGDYYWTQNGLASGAVQTFTYIYGGFATSGDHALWVQVDSFDNVAGESNEGNNISGPMTVTSSTPLPDLVVQNTSTNPLTPTIDQPCTLIVEVKNQGVAAVTDTFRIDNYVDPTTPPVSGTLNSSPWWQNGLAIGASATLTRTVVFTSGGEHDLYAQVDTSGVITESDESNNLSRRYTTTVYVPMPDLVVESISTDPTTPTIGYGFDLHVAVRNQGDKAFTDTFRVDWYQDPTTPPVSTTLGDGYWPQDGLDVGEVITFTTRVTIPMPGSHYFYAQADTAVSGTGAITESDESNNITGPVMATVDLPKPDLVVERITTSPARPMKDQTTTLQVVVKNQGYMATGSSFRVDWYRDPSAPPSAGETGDGFWTVASLAAGAVTTLTTSIVFTQAHTYDFYAQADTLNTSTETDESNNVHGPTDVAVFTEATSSALCGTISENTILTTAYNVYVVSCDVTVAANRTLWLNPGVIVKFDLYMNLTLEDSATLHAVGTSGSQIVFTSLRDDTHGGDTNGDGSATGPNRGDWNGIGYTWGGTGNQIVFDYVLVRYGDGVRADGDTDVRNTTIEQNYYTGLSLNAIDGDNPTLYIESSTIHNNGDHGIYANSYSTVMITDTVVESNVDSGIRSYGNLTLVNSQINANQGSGSSIYAGVYQSGNSATISGCTINNNDNDGIYSTNAVLSVSDSTISDNGWGDYDHGIEVNGSPSQVSILRNVISDNAGDGMNVSASAVVRNNTVTGNGDSAGNWGIVVSGNGLTVEDNTLHNNASGIFTSNYAGTTGLVHNNVISRSTATGFTGVGVMADGDGQPMVSDNTIVGYWVPVEMRDGYPAILPTFINNTISNSRHDGMIGIYGRLEPGVWGSAVSGYAPFVTGDLTVPAGAHFTFPAGSIVKFAYWYSNNYDYNTNSAGGIHLEQSAVLSATGAVGSPVVFTSGKDDTYGGDTNGDGGSSTPNRGDWGSIWGACLGTACSQVIFDYVLVRYGDGVSVYGATDIRNTTIEQSYGTGLRFYAVNGANPMLQVKSSTIRDNDDHGIYANSYSTVLITDTVIESNVDSGIRSYGNLTLVNSQVNANQGSGNSTYAGVYQSGNSATISGCTINNNDNDGIYSTNAVLSVSDSTISDNGWGESDHGIEVNGSPSQVSILRNTINNNEGDGINVSASASVRNNTMTGNGDSAGDWGIVVSGNGLTVEDNTLYNNASGIFVSNDAGTTGLVHNNVISRSTATGFTGAGIFADGDGQPTVSDNTIVGYWAPVGMRDGYPALLPTFTNNTISSSRHEGLIGIYGRLEPGAWGSAVSGYAPFVTGDLTIPAGAHFTFPAGSIVKFAYWYSNNYDYNTNSAGGLTLEQGAVLTATGTVGSPIVFTSGKDDVYGGDTNGDGGASTPNRGDWGSIWGACLGTLCSQVIFDNVLVRYGDGVGVYGETDIRNTTIEQSYGTGLSFYAADGANPTMRVENTTIRDNYSDGVYVNTYSTVEIDNTIIENNGYDGISSRGTLTLNRSQINANYDYGLYQSGNSATVSNCTIDGNWQDGIRIIGGVVMSVRETTISNNHWDGINLSNADPAGATLTFRNNKIVDNWGDGFELNGTAATIRDNDVANNGGYGINNLSSSITLDGRDNWWGDFSGPYHAVKNPLGIGNRVSNYVDIDPWVGKAEWIAYQTSLKAFWTEFFAEPVNVVFGNYIYHHTDLSFPARGLPFSFDRHYSSMSEHDGSLGYGWTHSYDVGVITSAIGITATALVRLGTGSEVRYFEQPDGSYRPPAGTFDVLTHTVGGQFRLTFKDQTVYNFDDLGRLSTIVDKNINTTTLSYTGDNLSSVQLADGRSVDFTYDGNNRLTQAQDPLGRELGFGYDASGDLTVVTDTRGYATTFAYDGNHQLLTATDANSHIFVDNTYDSNGRVVEQLDADNNLSTFYYDIGNHQTVVTDALGHPTIYNYDDYKRIKWELDELGFYHYYWYDNDNNRTWVRDKNVNTTNYAYDSWGNITAITDTLGYTTTYLYDVNHNPLRRTNPAGYTTYFEYDVHGNPITTTDPLSGTTVFVYNDWGKVLRSTDASGATKEYAYDTCGNQVAITDALSHVTTFTYDIVGRKTGETDPEGRTAAYAYDTGNHVTVITDALGYTMSYTYDPVGNKLGETNPLAHTTNYGYDAKSRLVVVTDTLGNAVTYAYDANDNRTSAADPLGYTTVYTYDVVNHLVATQNPLGYVTVYAYDGKGNRLSTTDPLSRTTRFAYDGLDHLVVVTDAVGHATIMAYDAVGNKVSTTDAEGRTTRYTYDPLKQLVVVTDALSGTMYYAYDAVGYKTVMTDANGHVTRYGYDALGHTVVITDPLGQATRYGYDNVGNRTVMTDANGQTTTFTYDALDNPIQVLYGDGISATRAYDPVGNRTAMTDTTGLTTFTYDELGRLVQSGQPGGTITYTYDALGHRTHVIYPDGKTVTTTFNALGQQYTVTDWASRVVTYTYDVAGQLVTVTNPNSVTVAYAYDAASHIAAITHTSVVSGVLEAYRYTYDNVGNRTTMSDTDGLTVYAYDALNRMVVVSYPVGSEAVTYTYDAMGNRLAMTSTVKGATLYTFDAADRLLSFGSQNCTWDNNGNMLTKGDQITYTYDTANRLTKVISATTVITFTYDGDGRRVGKSVNGVSTTYLYDVGAGLDVVLVESMGGQQTRYIYGHDLLAHVDDVGDPTFYHYDGLGSTRLLSNLAGQQVARYTYDVFGAVRTSSGAADTDFTFTGEQWDAESGLLYLRARYYDPELGRFLTRDPMPGFAAIPQTLNPYVYSRNNPQTLTDPSGEYALLDDVGLFAVGALKGVAKQYIGDVVGNIADGRGWDSWKPRSSWQEYTISGISGGVGAWSSQYLTPIGGSMVEAGLETALKDVWINGERDWRKVAGHTIGSMGITGLGETIGGPLGSAFSKGGSSLLDDLYNGQSLNWGKAAESALVGYGSKWLGDRFPIGGDKWFFKTVRGKTYNQLLKLAVHPFFDPAVVYAPNLSGLEGIQGGWGKYVSGSRLMTDLNRMALSASAAK